MVDGIVALGEQAGDAQRIEPIDADEFAQDAIGGQRQSGVAKRHREAAQGVRRLEMIALHFAEQFGIDLDRFAGAAEAMQQQPLHRLRMLVRRVGLGVLEDLQRRFVIRHRGGAEPHLMADADILRVEFMRAPVVLQRRRRLEAAQIGMREQHPRLDRLGHPIGEVVQQGPRHPLVALDHLSQVFDQSRHDVRIPPTEAGLRRAASSLGEARTGFMPSPDA